MCECSSAALKLPSTGESKVHEVAHLRAPTLRMSTPSMQPAAASTLQAVEQTLNPSASQQPSDMCAALHTQGCA